MTDTSELRRLLAAGGRDLPWEVDDPATGYMRIMGQIDGDADDNGRPIITWPHIADIIDAGDYDMVAALIVSGINALPALLDEIDRLRVEVKRMREALEPFATFSDTFVDENGGWAWPSMSERIVDWFGPSDFRAARAALEADHG